MKKWRMATTMVAVGMLLPGLSHGQGMAGDIHSLQGVLEQLYDEMIPLCSKLISVGRGIAGFGATWYIASRVWRHIANAEPIDFYPLFRPFVLGFCIMIFPSVLAMINGIMKPTVSATSEMVKGSNQAIAQLLKKKEEALRSNNSWKMYVGTNGRGNRDEWYKYTYGQDVSEESLLGVPGNDIRFAMDKMAYSVKNSIKEWMSIVLQVIFEAAALCINTLRTFQLVVLAILGPLVFGIAVFDGFQHTLTSWIARYINVYLWLPVANIFGAIIAKVQEKMIALDIGQIQDQGQTVFSAADTGYLIFMLIGIVGYFTVPSVANFIVNAGFGGAMQQKITSMTSSMGSTAASGGIAVGGRAAETGGNILRIPQFIYEGYRSKDSGGSSHMGDKLSGKSAKHSAIKERISGSILRIQKVWAIWIGNYVNSLSRRGKEVILVLFILISVSWSLLLMIRQPQSVLNTDSITKPVPIKNNKGSSSSVYLDSLSSAEGARHKDSLASKR